MTTRVTRLTQVSADAAALAPIVLPSADEVSLYGNARLKNWWRADAGVDTAAKKWRCRKTEAALVPTKGTFPAVINAAGQLASINVSAGGTGYTTAPNVTIAAPPAGGTQAKGLAVVAAGVVTGVTLTNPGSGYLAAPAVTIIGAGTGATATSTITATDRYAGQKTVQFDTGVGTNASLYDGGLNLLPINASFSVVFVGRAGPGDQGYMWGNALNAQTAGGIGMQITAPGATSVGSNNGNVLNNSSTGALFAAGPIFHLTSWDEAGDVANQQSSPSGINQSLAKADATRITNGEFHLGDDYSTALTGSAAHYIEGGDVAEVMIFDAALHLAPNAALLAQVKAYLLARYGIAM